MPAHMRPNVTKRPGNRNYCNGANAERQAKKLLEAEGWIVGRFAGSKGPKGADLVATRPTAFVALWTSNPHAPPTVDVLWVSCKKDAGRETKRAQLAELPGRVELWHKTARKGWEREVIK
jgi:hypothetical protein